MQTTSPLLGYKFHFSNVSAVNRRWRSVMTKINEPNKNRIRMCIFTCDRIFSHLTTTRRWQRQRQRLTRMEWKRSSLCIPNWHRDQPQRLKCIFFKWNNDSVPFFPFSKKLDCQLRRDSRKPHHTRTVSTDYCLFRLPWLPTRIPDSMRSFMIYVVLWCGWWRKLLTI